MTNLFQNEMWKIDADGLDTLDEEYFIEKGLLLKSYESSGKITYCWPFHMASKKGVDFELFLEAWLNAIDIHKESIKTNLSAVTLEHSISGTRNYLKSKDDPKQLKFLAEISKNLGS